MLVLRNRIIYESMFGIFYLRNVKSHLKYTIVPGSTGLGGSNVTLTGIWPRQHLFAEIQVEKYTCTLCMVETTNAEYDLVILILQLKIPRIHIFTVHNDQDGSLVFNKRWFIKRNILIILSRIPVTTTQFKYPILCLCICWALLRPV